MTDDLKARLERGGKSCQFNLRKMHSLLDECSDEDLPSSHYLMAAASMDRCCQDLFATLGVMDIDIHATQRDTAREFMARLSKGPESTVRPDPPLGKQPPIADPFSSW